MWLYEAIMHFAVAYMSYCCVSFILVTIARYIFKTEHFSAVKLAMGYKKNISFLVIPKSPKFKKKSDWAPLRANKPLDFFSLH